MHVRHDMEGPPGSAAVLHLQFLVNEGSLISATADDSIHLWNFKQKVPQIAQSLKFTKDRITYMHLPLQSKWLYVGTERGNIHVIQTDSFALSGYIINWNKAIEMTRKTHPGCVVHLSDNPLDASKLLIGYECGLVVLWDLKIKQAEMRCQTAEPLRSIAWHHEGKQFMCSHTDGSLTTWNIKQNNKPIHISQPHAKTNKDGKLEQCKPITKVAWILSRSGEPYLIFSGGMPYDQSGRTPSITVVYSKTTTVLEMEHNVIDFITLCESPYPSEIPIVYEIPDENEYSPDCQFSGPGSAGSGSKLDTLDYDNKKELVTALKVRQGSQKKAAGFQAQLVCLTPYNNGEPPSKISALTLNSSYGLMAYGNEAGIVIVDIEQKVCLLNVGSPDLYGAQDPYSRAPRSPKKNHASGDCLPVERDDRQLRSPSIDQMGRSPESPYPLCPTPDETTPDAADEAKAIPIPQAATTRRRSSAWKGFNFKRQLSKVDMKLKNTFSSGDHHHNHSKEKRNSIFYSDISPSAPDLEEAEEKSSPESDDDTVVENSNPHQKIKQDSKDDDEDSLVEESFLVGSLGTQYEIPSKKVGFANRPNNLDLFDENGFPIRPPRYKKKMPDKRDQRLMSVPNIKFQRAELRDLRDKDEKDWTGNRDQASFAGNLMRRFNKLDSSFSRSRSSSMSSLENITSEAIQCLTFADSYTKRSDPNTITPTLWVGTSLGSVLTILITPTDPDSRTSQPVVVSLVGVTIFRLKGSILNMSFLDSNGALIPYGYESWKDENKEKKDKTPTKVQNRTSPTPNDNQNRVDPFGDRQYVVITSEKQARVVGLPSQTCLYRSQIADTDFVVKAEIVSLKDSVCLVCYVSNGHLMAYTLPSLRPLIDIDFLPLSELRITRSFCFSNRGHGLYLASPSELQKFTLCTEFCSNLSEMTGELFLAAEMPEPPKEGFFKGLFGGGVRSLDREELFGEASGKANKSIAKHIPGSMAEMNARVTSSASEIARAQKLAMERGEKLNKLEDNAERLRNEAETYASSAHDLMLKYRDKKWYQI